MGRTSFRHVIKSGNTAKMEAVKLIQGLFDTAETEDCLKEVWAIMSALRDVDTSEDINDRLRGSKIVTDIRRVVITQVQAKVLDLVYKGEYTNRPPMTQEYHHGVSNLHANSHFSMAINVLRGAAKESSTCLKLVS